MVVPPRTAFSASLDARRPAVGMTIPGNAGTSRGSYHAGMHCRDGGEGKSVSRRDTVEDLEVRAYAKVNLGLDILGRRDDGYHEIHSIFQCIELSDLISLHFSPGGRGAVRLQTDYPGVLGGADNLILRATRALNFAPGVNVRLQKRIPVGGGLGGGSSDAAATLVALHAAGNPGHPGHPGSLREIAAGLGADVPFFLEGGTAEIRGVGEIIEPLPPMPPYPVLLMVPPLACDTGAVYRHHDALEVREGEASVPSVLEGMGSGDLGSALRCARNALEPAALARYPALRAYADHFRARVRRPVLMSGSGSTFFAVYEDCEEMAWDLRRLRWEFAFRGARLLATHFRSGPGWNIRDARG